MAASGKGLDLLDKRLTDKLASNQKEFDPLMIIAIIMAIIQIIQGCLIKNPRFLRFRFLNRTRLAAMIRRHVPELSWADAFSKADEVFTLADEATDDELKLLVDDCCS